MNERACRNCIGVSAALFPLIGAFAALTHNERTWIAAAVCAGAALVLWLRLEFHRRFIALVLRAAEQPAPQGYEVSLIQNESELQEMWNLNCELYGEGALDFETYLRWWNKYPASIHALRLDGRIEGGITLWPLKAKPFKNFLRARCGLNADYFYAVHEAAQCRHWLVSGIAIRPGARSPQALRYLLMRALRSGLETSKAQFSLNACAIASSPQGAKLLERFGFVQSKERMPDGCRRYALTNIGPRLIFRMALRINRYRQMTRPAL